MTSKHSILIVDDEPHSQDVLAGLLAKEGYQLDFAGSGQEALDYVHQHNPDVILLDVMMPDISGFDVCHRLKNNQEFKHIPIIIVTALGSKQDLVRGFEAGADDFLTKPVGKVELLARVRSMLRIKNQYDELKSLSDLREELARAVMHDMRTPLNVILAYVEFYQLLESSEAEKLGYIKNIESQAYRLNAFLTDMLMMTKMEADQFVLRYSTVKLDKLLDQVVKDHAITAQSRGIQMILQMPDQPPTIQVDVNLFQRVLDNLISNAVKFSPSGGTVTVQVKYQPQNVDSPPNALKAKVTINILDEGPGIPQEYRQRIFEKFEAAKLQQKGVIQIGLGLAFCKMVIDAHNGSISVQDNDPTGSIFTVEI